MACEDSMHAHNPNTHRHTIRSPPTLYVCVTVGAVAAGDPAPPRLGGGTGRWISGDGKGSRSTRMLLLQHTSRCGGAAARCWLQHGMRAAALPVHRPATVAVGPAVAADGSPWCGYVPMKSQMLLYMSCGVPWHCRQWQSGCVPWPPLLLCAVGGRSSPACISMPIRPALAPATSVAASGPLPAKLRLCWRARPKRPPRARRASADRCLLRVPFRLRGVGLMAQV